MVAKTFKDYKIVSEVYEQGKNRYVKVQHPRTGNIRQVRWYTEAEYLKKYPEDAELIGNPFNQKKMLGFDKGYITLFKGDIITNADWFSSSNARYHCTWGWYIVSTEKIPSDLPAGVEPVTLKWEEVSSDDKLLPQSNIKTIVEQLLFSDSKSSFIGEIGERLALKVIITNAAIKESIYGITTTHTMEDEEGNVYIWQTSAKSWKEGEPHSIRGTVKEHKVCKGVKQTVLTRCIEK